VEYAIVELLQLILGEHLEPNPRIDAIVGPHGDNSFVIRVEVQV
jgi:hypothetical protein